MPIYMQFGQIKGDVQESNHAQWVEVNSVNWGFSNAISSALAASATRDIGKPQVTDLCISKQQDIATIPLIQAGFTCNQEDVQIDFCRTDSSGMTVFYSIKATNALIGSFQQSCGSDGRPMETITLNFTAIECTGTQMNADGTDASPASFEYNLQDS